MPTSRKGSVSVWICSGEFTSGLSKLETQLIAERGSAALTCGKPPAFRPLAQPPSSSAQAGRLSLPACAEEVLQDSRPTGRQSHPTRQAAEPQLVADRTDGNLEKPESTSPRGGAKAPLRQTETLPTQEVTFRT